MRAWQLKESGLSMEDIPRPEAGQGEVLVRVHTAGVTSTELLWYPTTHTKAGERRANAVPGHEFAGIITAVGTGASGVVVGQEVYGMNDWFADGATAEYCPTRPDWIAPKPHRLACVEAASVPIGALTAWQGLFDRAKLQRGETVLIHGGSGGVGVFAVQLAHWQGARVITTASARNREFLLELGADEVIDYRTERFEDRVKGVDVVFDAVGGATLERSWAVLAHSGRLVTIAADGEQTSDERVKSAFFIVEPNREQLSRIGELLDAGQLRPVVDAVVPFEQAAAAYAGQIGQRLGRGKVVVIVAQPG